MLLECSNVNLQLILTNKIRVYDTVIEFHWLTSLEPHLECSNSNWNLLECSNEILLEP